MRKTVKQADFRDEWKYVVILKIFASEMYSKSLTLEWSSKRPGTFLVKGMNLFSMET